MENTTEHLFAVADDIDRWIAYLEKKAMTYEEKGVVSDLKAYRAHIQEGIESLVSQAEDQMNEGGY